MTVTLSQINVYPVKSLGGGSVGSARVEARGLQHDRRWMLVDPNGKFLTQRELPRMALVSASVHGERLVLSAPGLSSLSVALVLPPDAEALAVRVWRSVCEAHAVDPVADDWLSDFLGAKCRLVHMPDSTRRTINPDFAAGEGIVSFADGYPMTLVGQASLDDLNRRLQESVPMDRFRPNLVVCGADAYAEDAWKTVRVGGVLFHAVKPCDRCVMTTVDQATGGRRGEEPLRTLSSYRLRDQKVLFAVFLIPAGGGSVQVGHAVEVLERRDAR